MTPSDLAQVGRAAIAKTDATSTVPKPPTTAIWDDGEVQTRDVITANADDGRRRPIYEILFGQHVGTEYVYLGMSDKTPSSLHADRMVVRVLLPGERMADIDLDVTEQKVTICSPR